MERLSIDQKLSIGASTDSIDVTAIGSLGKTKITLHQNRLIDPKNRAQQVEVYVDVSGCIWKGSLDDLGKLISVGVAATEYLKSLEEK